MAERYRPRVHPAPAAWVLHSSIRGESGCSLHDPTRPAGTSPTDPKGCPTPAGRVQATARQRGSAPFLLLCEPLGPSPPRADRWDENGCSLPPTDAFGSPRIRNKKSRRIPRGTRLPSCALSPRRTEALHKQPSVGSVGFLSPQPPKTEKTLPNGPRTPKIQPKWPKMAKNGHDKPSKAPELQPEGCTPNGFRRVPTLSGAALRLFPNPVFTQGLLPLSSPFSDILISRFTLRLLPRSRAGRSSPQAGQAGSHRGPLAQLVRQEKGAGGTPAPCVWSHDRSGLAA